VNYVVAAEAEGGEWATCRFDGGDPYEVTSMCAAVGALTMLEEVDSMNVQECGGIVTPAFAFANSGFLDRLKKHRWACSPKGASVNWEVKEGTPTWEEMMEKWKGRSQAYVVMMPDLQNGSVKQWAPPEYALT